MTAEEMQPASEFKAVRPVPGHAPGSYSGGGRVSIKKSGKRKV